MRHLGWFGMVAIAAWAVMACGQEGTSSTTDENDLRSDGSNVDVLTKADDGRTVTVGEGKDVVVELPSGAWKVVSTDKNFGYPTTTTGDGVERFTWKTRGPLSLIGEHVVKMERTGDTFTFTVKIVRSACPELMPPGPSFCSGGRVGTRQNAYGCTVFTCEYRTDRED